MLALDLAGTSDPTLTLEERSKSTLALLFGSQSTLTSFKSKNYFYLGQKVRWPWTRRGPLTRP